MEDFSDNRYHRQIILKDFGESSQKRLLDAKVLVIGAGGLGCPALQYLTGAGIGTIGIIDDDKVSLDNLHRQPLFNTHDIGQPKAGCAAEKLKLLNPEISFRVFNERLSTLNCLERLQDFDTILDCTDNFATRYMINDACVLLGKPLVYGAVSQYEGQVAVFNYDNGSEEPVNYRDLFPEPPKESEVLSCAEAGVLGVLPGIIGTMQAAETIKLITGIGTPLANRLYTYNLLNNAHFELELQKRKDPVTPVPLNAEEFKKTDYNWLCRNDPHLFEISAEIFDEWIESGEAMIIDVREENELPEVTEFEHTRIPVSQIEENISKIKDGTVIFFCQAGSRSKRAAKIFSDITGKASHIYSLQGGIIKWKQNTKRTDHV